MDGGCEDRAACIQAEQKYWDTYADDLQEEELLAMKFWESALERGEYVPPRMREKILGKVV